MKKSTLSSVMLAGALAVAGTAAVQAANLPSFVEFNRNGSFRIGEAEFVVQSYNSSWTPQINSNWSKIKSSRRADELTVTGGLKNADRIGAVTETIRALDAASFAAECRFHFDSPVPFNALFGTLILPESTAEITVNGRTVALPRRFKEMTVLSEKKLESVRIKLSGGLTLTISGARSLTVQDNRKFNSPAFSLRFPFSPSSGNITDSALKLKFAVDTVPNRSVDLAPVVNRGFADAQAGDGKGGWSDQGPENDFRAFKLKQLQVQGLRFEIVDPARHRGKAVAVVGGELCRTLPHAITLKLPADASAGAVNLLHASAWTPAPGKTIGTMTVKFADGGSQQFPVVSRTDCGNWWLESPGKNAFIAWSAENASSPIGLYASSFPLRGSAPREIVFRAADPKVMWMIVGVNLSAAPVTFVQNKDKDTYIVGGRDWLPLEFRRETLKNSPLDFSWTLDAPAGKYGFITASPSGTLTFTGAPGKRIRLYGVNLCFSASFLTKDVVDRLAETFVRNGYNTVRIHHHDTEMLDPKAKDTLTFDPKKIDRLDYLFYAMKKHGLYIVTDLYTNRVFKPGDNIPECTFYSERQMKMLIPVSTAAMNNWKEFARRWMNHKNPYTGLKWGEDPALFCLNLVNEEGLTGQWKAHPDSIALYQKKFDEWKKRHGFTGGRADSSDRLFGSFLLELQDRCLAEQLRFVKQDLKLRSMITSLNNMIDVSLTLMRNRFDLVDNHSYFDHPSFLEQRWRLPFRYRQQCAVNRMAQVPRTMMPTRIFGKPFIVTEFNYCNPNLFRAEGGPLIGAYSALQDWDALYRFAWSHSSAGIQKVTAARGFDAVNDPMAQLADRIAIAMFLRGDVAPARPKFAYRVSPRLFQGSDPLRFPSAFETLGLVAQIGAVVDGSPVPAGVTALSPAASTEPAKLADRRIAAAWERALNTKTAVSATGQITLDGEKYGFTVSTPRTESVTLKNGSLSSGLMTVKKADSFQTVAAIALDGKPLAASGSILVIHLTNVANTKQHFGNESKTVLKNYGELPLLVYRGRATVALAGKFPFKVTALSADGVPRGEVKGELAGGVFSFPADPGCFPGGVMAYHLTR